MLSTNMIISLQQAMNGLWFRFKEIRGAKDSLGLKDEDLKDFLLELLELESLLRKKLNQKKGVIHAEI